LSEAEEAQALLSLDPIAAMAASDKAKLEELMASVQSDDERVQAMMAEMGEKLSGFQFDPDTLVDSFSGAVDGDSEYGSVTLTDKRDIIEEIKELVKSVGMETACALFLEVLKNA